MRKFKFRAWDKKNKKMFLIKGFAYNVDGSISVFVPRAGYLRDVIYKKKDIEIMQYIGRKDKKGKEIFEGDVLKFYHKNNNEWFGFGFCYYDEEDTCFKHTYQEVHNNEIEYDSYRPSKRFWCNNNVICEIIGNIDENSELFKGE
jgi:uncharacterized phage protein (TIGR01671 family)